MAQIYLETHIKAPVERVFDLSRSIDFHKFSMHGTKEEAIAGKTKGLIELNETVTWKARHFGVYQNLTVRITKFERPHLFKDEMIKGAFRRMEHTHQFREDGDGTNMTDTFKFTSPAGFLGHIADFLFLEKYMRHFLLLRNKELKDVAEGDNWKQFINTDQ